MTGPASRRGFLRRLVSLPLIGGGLTLTRNPIAAAVPITGGTAATYLTWLHFEARKVACALGCRGFTPMMNPGAGFHDRPRDTRLAARPAVERAPVIPAAVGCPLSSAEVEEQAAQYGFDCWRQGGTCA